MSHNGPMWGSLICSFIVLIKFGRVINWTVVGIFFNHMVHFYNCSNSSHWTPLLESWDVLCWLESCPPPPNRWCHYDLMHEPMKILVLWTTGKGGSCTGHNIKFDFRMTCTRSYSIVVFGLPFSFLWHSGSMLICGCYLTFYCFFRSLEKLC